MNSRTFKIEKDPFYEGETIYLNDKITLNPGVTVLVGCNGSGKTTLIKILKSQLEKAKVPVVSYNNLQQGGDKSISAAMFEHDLTFAATSWTASEGEQISLNLGKFVAPLRDFIHKGTVQEKAADKFARLMSGTDKRPDSDKFNERWIFLDAIDSGLSIDNIVELHELFKIIIFDAPSNVDVYIVMSANEYELARNQNCFDVTRGQYITFNDYEEYRDFILDSKLEKDKREESEEQE
jgi:energy-coupling factor transporter ATP-binding protein EcfA2